MKFSDLLRMRGNGCAGSSPSGDSTGISSFWKYVCSQASCSGLHSLRRTKRICSCSSAGSNTSLNTRYCSAINARARVLIAARISAGRKPSARSEEHTSELQSLMRISYAVFCLKKNRKYTETHKHSTSLHKNNNNYH